MNTKLTVALAAALLPALSLAAEPAETHITGKSPTPAVVVHYGDLDLSSPKGAQTLQARLNDAAWQVCEQTVDHLVSVEGTKCRTQVVADAQQKVATR